MTKSRFNEDGKAQKVEETRKRMDELDRELIQMLETRVELSSVLAELETIDETNEVEQVATNAKERCAGLITVDFVRDIYRRVFSETFRLRGANILKVGFQGEHGAYGEVASRMLVPNASYIPCLEFADVFIGVEMGLFDVGAVPVENSLEGAVTQVNDLLTTTKLSVVGEVKVPIHHCLLAPANVALEDIRIVYSHPQALAQCRQFTLKHRFESRPFYNTAGAAKMIDRERPLGAAAIASELCSKLYGLSIVERDIEDADSNSTRFLLIARDKFEGPGDKCSVILAVKHEAGALKTVLSLFSEANINLTRIASTPRRGDPGNYTFFVDFEGCDQDPKIIQLIEEIDRKTKEMLFLGCYPKWDIAHQL
jgi:prephenate dehydratase/chorismate mutase